ncbi:sensory transduction histidine kinase [hydrocarbon metagenome]|uniref:histidine kinase n=1 Tax=hydrocarbon metagenome TaxID=938273 RepID=A0A0W8FGC0_9ZZZZ
MTDATRSFRSAGKGAKIRPRAQAGKRTARILNEIIAAAHAADTLPDLLRSTMAVAFRLLAYDGGGVYLVQPGTRTADLVYAERLSAAFVEEVSPVAIDREPYRTVFIRGEPVITNRYGRLSPDRAAKYGIRSAASIPIRGKDSVIGALNVMSTRRTRILEEDAAVLTSIGRIIGDAIERIQSEQRLLLQQKNLETFADSISDLLFVIGRDGRIIEVNEAVVEHTGYSRNELAAMAFADLHPPELREGALAIDCMTGGTRELCTVPLQTKDGRRLEVETRIAQGQWNNEDVLFAVCRDLTERRRAEEALHAAYAKLEDRVRLRTADLRAANIALHEEISGRKQVEDALRESEERYRMLVEWQIEAVCRWLPDTTLTYVNEGYCRFFGRTRRELIGTKWLMLVPEHSRAAVEEAYASNTLPAAASTYEHEVIAADGSIRWMQWTDRPIIDADGRVVEFQSAGRDITDIRKAEKALRESEEKYRRLIETLNEGVWAIDAEGHTTFANPRMAEMPGYTVDEMIGMHLFEFMEESEAKTCIRNLERGRRGLREHHEFVFLRKDGNRIHTGIETSPIFDAGGTYAGALAAVIDISERRKAEEALRESEEKYRTLVELSPDGILIHQDGRITYINPAGMKLLRASRPEDIVGMDVFAIVHPDHHDAVREKIRLDLEEGESPPLELQMLRLDGTAIPVEGRGGRMFIDGRPAVQVFFRDVSLRKLAEKQLQSQNRQLVVLNQIIGISASALSLDELLEGSLAKTLDLLGYDTGAVYMLDPARKQALLRHHRNIPEMQVKQNRAIKIHHWPLNYVFVAGRPWYVSDTGSQRNRADAGALQGIGASSLAAIPLIAESIVVGGLFVGRAADSQPFSPDDRALLEAIGQEIGAGILRCMLQKRVEAAYREANLYLDILTHDIKNAENVSSIYSELLLEILNGKPAEYARKLRASIRKSIDILGNVSTIRRIHHEKAHLVPVGIDAVIRNEIGNFPEVAITYEDSGREVWADRLLSEVFTNLIGNAVKFGGPDVGIAVTVESFDDEDNTVLVSVEDTGPGVPDETKESIFHRFEQGRSQGRGEGLGLFITKTLIERYGGRIWAEDRVPGHPELGAAFRFTLREAAGDREEDAGNGDLAAADAHEEETE